MRVHALPHTHTYTTYTLVHAQLHTHKHVYVIYNCYGNTIRPFPSFWFSFDPVPSGFVPLNAPPPPPPTKIA